MFHKGKWYEKPRQLLKLRLQRANYPPLDTDAARRMVEVEYGLCLMEFLCLLKEPIIAVPDLLTLHELPVLHQLSFQHWQALAYARYRIPSYISHQRWRDDLMEYSKLPSIAQLYAVHTDKLDMEILSDVIKAVDNPNDFSIYENMLTTRPPYQISDKKQPIAGQLYHFYVFPHGRRGKYPVSVTFPEDTKIGKPAWDSTIPKQDTVPLERYVQKQQKPERKPLTFHWQRDIVAESKVMEAQDPKGLWEERTAMMKLSIPGHDQTPDEFVIDGTVHLVGMVGAGKTTLVKVLSHCLVRTTNDTRIAIIVPSTMEAFKLANEMNQLLKCDLEKPAAVVYYGWGTRDKHIRAFLNEYGHDLTHFGHRWVSNSCALMSHIAPANIATINTMPHPGTEPCETLADSPLEHSTTDDVPFRRPDRNTRCPYFADCPSHQKLRDLEQARIVVTTAGALQSRLPAFFDPRRLLLADYLYEQMDVVFVDEADEVQAFEDDQFVNMIPLWNLEQALFSDNDAAISDAVTLDDLTEMEENWAFSLREGAKYIRPMLRMLSQVGSATLKRWIGRSYFSAYRLFQMVARRMLGLPDWVAVQSMTPDQQEQYNYLRDIFSLLSAGDFTKLPDPDYLPHDMINPYGSLDKVWFACKLRDILAQASANIPHNFESRLLHLMSLILDKIDVVLEDSLAMLDEALQASTDDNKRPYMRDEDRETPESLAHKLMFTLLAAGLDREIRLLVYNEDARPKSVASLDARSFNPNFQSAHEALPLAYTGAAFGTYYTPEEREPEQTQGSQGYHESLSRLEYINPGRELLLRFNKLYSAFNISGPHIVFLSGTSWLPDSTRWHIRTPIGAILEANTAWSEAIQHDSQYAFTPTFDEKGKPIRISGAGNTAGDYDRAKEDALVQVAAHWGREKTLEKQLETLRLLGEAHSEKWGGRERILLFVNSYYQAKVLAKAIQHYTSLADNEVGWLIAGDDEDDILGITRASIEQVAMKTQFKILVAPMQAIGRGHNILTPDNSKAAFGAAYFVVRPLTPPGDIKGIAAEINCYGAQWLCPDNPHPIIASKHTAHEQETELRRLALEHWHRGERRTYYHYLSPAERRDLAATTLGRLIQASGRLVRGGVPMLINFIDAAWAPHSAERQAGKHRQSDTVHTSLLAAMVCRLRAYLQDDNGKILYQPFAGLLNIDGLYFNKEKCDE